MDVIDIDAINVLDIMKVFNDRRLKRREKYKEYLALNFNKLTQEQIEKIIPFSMRSDIFNKKKTTNFKGKKYKKAERLLKLLREARKIHNEICDVNLDHLFLTVHFKDTDEDYSFDFDLYEELIKIVTGIAAQNSPKILVGGMNSISELKEAQIFDAKNIFDNCNEIGLSKTYTYEIISYLTGLDKQTIPKILSNDASHLHPLEVFFKKNK